MNPEFLAPARFVDSDHPDVIAFAHRTAGVNGGSLDRILRLFYTVRDEILYDPYVPLGDPGSYRASTTLERGRGFCIPKAALLAACLRVIGVPARVGYADVRNHLATPRMREITGSDLYTYHSYTDIWIEDRWVKATPAFNKAMCDKFGVKPLDFDGRNDCLFHAYDREGRQHMEYLRDRGTFADVPHDEIVVDFRQRYPKMFSDPTGIKGDFQAEAGTG